MGCAVAELPPLADACPVTVIVPARDAATTVGDALRSACAQRPPVAEVLVGTDPADRVTRQAVAAVADPRVRIVDVPGGRTPDALQTLVEAARGEVIVRLDAHAVLPPGYVDRAVSTLRRTGAANVGGRQVPTATGGFAAAVAAAMASPAGAGGATYRTGDVEGPVDTVYLGVFRAAALHAVGGFDRRMTRNQDAELNLRLTRAGHTVWFDPSLAVAYTPRGTVAGLARQYRDYGRWRRVTARTHPGSLQPRQLAAPTLVAGLGAATALAAVTRRAAPVAVPAAAYTAGLVAAAVHARPGGIAAVGRTAVALGTMHLSWGLGFWQGPPREARRAGVGRPPATRGRPAATRGRRP